MNEGNNGNMLTFFLLGRSWVGEEIGSVRVEKKRGEGGGDDCLKREYKVDRKPVYMLRLEKDCAFSSHHKAL